jgi:hypothetical protein
VQSLPFFYLEVSRECPQERDIGFGDKGWFFSRLKVVTNVLPSHFCCSREPDSLKILTEI